MRFSTEDELFDAGQESIDELTSEDHMDEATVLAGTARLGGRTDAEAISLLITAAVLLSAESTASAMVGSAGTKAAYDRLTEATQEAYEIDELERALFGPGGPLYGNPFFAGGAVI